MTRKKVLDAYELVMNYYIDGRTDTFEPFEQAMWDLKEQALKETER